MLQQVMAELTAHAHPENKDGMRRFGINTSNTLGIPVGELRQIARPYRGQQSLAEQLWATGLRDARLLACFMGDPKTITPQCMEAWVSELDSWDVCDGLCLHLLRRSPQAHRMAREWTQREPEFVRRAGFTMIACLAVHDRAAPDEVFLEYLALARQGAPDGRNFVKKAVNWAVRQIGKRNRVLHEAAIAAARDILEQDTRSARWIGRDALRELLAPSTLARLQAKSQARHATRGTR